MGMIQIKFAGTFRNDIFLEASNVKFKKDLIILYNKRRFVAVFNRNDIMYIRRR